MKEVKAKKHKLNEGCELIALKDFLIFQNDYKQEIKKGDNISVLNIPEKFIENLKTENVI